MGVRHQIEAFARVVLENVLPAFWGLVHWVGVRLFRRNSEQIVRNLTATTPSIAEKVLEPVRTPLGTYLLQFSRMCDSGRWARTTHAEIEVHRGADGLHPAPG
jgi:hypothetical protein